MSDHAAIGCGCAFFPNKLVLLNRSNHRRPKALASVLGPVDRWTTLYSTIVLGIIATLSLVLENDAVACPTYIVIHICSHLIAITHRPLLLDCRSQQTILVYCVNT
jgi:hypothetical protein